MLKALFSKIQWKLKILKFLLHIEKKKYTSLQQVYKTAEVKVS